MRYSTEMFVTTPNKKCLITDASMLARLPHSPFGRIYQDSYDIGLILVSHKTGAEATFYVDRVNRALNEERDIQSWVLKPTIETLRKIPQFAGWTISVFNT